MLNRVYILLLASTILIIAASSCRKENILTDSSAKLGFTSDTILFDTVFTTIGSVTKHFKILNTHNRALKISSIDLASGTNSNFRINVDGISGVSFNDIEIPANDSLFVFVEVTVDPVGINTPLIVEDSVLFITNGNEQKVWLHAWGQDAYFHNRETLDDATWTNDKPHVIYGYVAVDSSQTLTIEPGTTVYSHNNAVLYVYKGSLNAVGSPGNEITFRGDRLASFLMADPDSVSGQWWGIRFFQPKSSNIEYVEIKNAIVGIQIDTLNTGQTVTLNKVRVNNSLYASIISQGSNVTATNCLFGNAGSYSGIVSYGGSQNFTYCTFGNFWTDTDRNTPLFLLTDYYYSGSTLIPRPFTQADFTNCIFYGPSGNDNEITLDTLEGSTPVFHFNSCLFRTDKIITHPTYYTNCKRNIDPNFTDPAIWDFHINTGGAENMGVSTVVFDDLDGVVRGNPSDVGCYEL
ncbi:MAG: hypothetical protein JKY54_11145 [Flavobacteriales bacterium]|nr:hypothetical protein [Flavobacteriales bacterium]